MTQQLTPEQTDLLAAEYFELAAQVAPLEERMKEIKTTLMNGLDYGAHDAAGGRVTISRGARTLDAAAFEKAYPVQVNPGLYKVVPDLDKIKAAIAPKQLEAVQKVGADKIGIK